MGKNLKGKEIGKGFRQRKDGRYEARARINGIEICIYDADLKALKVLFETAKEKARNSIDTKKEKITLIEWFDEWFDTYKVPVVKETSIFSMKSKFYNTFGRLLGDKKLCDISNIDVQEAINILKKEGRANSSIRDAFGRLRECLESAKNNMLLLTNPCFDIVVPWERSNSERIFLTQEEEERFLKEVEYNWYKELFHVMFYTGLRIGEVGALRWENIDFKNKCINVEHSLHCAYENGEKKIAIVEPKTFNSYRLIPFVKSTEQMLLSQKQKVDDLKSKLGDRYRGKGEYADCVFVTSMGSPVLRYHAEKEIKKIVNTINQQELYQATIEKREPIEFKNLYPHAIRHTFCSRCFEKGIHPKVVQKIMGHQSYSTTIDIYTHVAENVMQNEIEKFNSDNNFDFTQLTELYPTEMNTNVLLQKFVG